MENMLKWRMNLGVTGFRPPPGGAQAALIVTSYEAKIEILDYSFYSSNKSSVIPDWSTTLSAVQNVL